MIRFRLNRSVAAALACAAYLITALASAAPRPEGAKCTQETTIREDGAIVTHWVCEVPAPKK